ncbi:hypothetical protein Trco_006580 [Trichoderma cornu-damae]|uniref:Dolichyl-diphosphooligosaccharide--protein glycosyltransferase subunit 4 n=1 Tax=Trichoderma cornu-damae TaxID=654480 RepID=A0A9P8QLG6_9HYPO|nr:hypothetical protein Trco_006580 [Trichoderma cornu-damae]
MQQRLRVEVQLQLSTFKMISDDELYKLAIFLGSISMVLIVVYHFLEVNAENKPAATVKKSP